MVCTLTKSKESDKNFQIEFKNLSELESLCDSLESMLVYYEQCKKDGETLPELVYRINNHK